MSKVQVQSFTEGVQAAHLYNKLMLTFLRSLFESLRSRGVALSTSTKTRISQVLRYYVTCYVRRDAVNHTDWVLPDLTCSCRDCAPISMFMRHPGEKTHRFKPGKSRRQHIPQNLNDKHCTHLTERSGNPQTMVVIIKTRKQYDEAHQAWLGRVQVAQKTVRDLDQDILRSVMGDQYDQLMGLHWIRQPLASVSDARTNGMGVQGVGSAQCRDSDIPGPMAPVASVPAKRSRSYLARFTKTRKPLQGTK